MITDEIATLTSRQIAALGTSDMIALTPDQAGRHGRRDASVRCGWQLGCSAEKYSCGKHPAWSALHIVRRQRRPVGNESELIFPEISIFCYRQKSIELQSSCRSAKICATQYNVLVSSNLLGWN